MWEKGGVCVHVSESDSEKRNPEKVIIFVNVPRCPSVRIVVPLTGLSFLIKSRVTD